MSPVQTVGQVFDAIQQAKAGAAEFCTNFFPVEKRLQEWIVREELCGEFRNGAAFFFRKDRDFQHLYFCATSPAVLKQEVAALPELKREKVVLDVVGKEAGLGELIALWEEASFRHFTRLFRMARSTPLDQPLAANDGEGISVATAADAPQILQLLEQEFNCYGEQIPLLYEVEAALALGQMLVARRDGEIAGLLFFETQGVTSTLRFWTVAAKYRALRLGSGLMRRYFATQNGVKRFVLWVAADNTNAVQKYEHYGYKPDGLVDYVLANQLIRS